LRTLSPNNPQQWTNIQGLLYVPELPDSSPCGNSTRDLIPSNATTRAQLPPTDIPLIAIAPWTQPACVQSYLSVMRSDAVHGALFFHNDNASALPPPVSDPSWSLNDGGQWKSTNGFPVYGIPATLGSYMLTQLALYSGNITQVPNGQLLIDQDNFSPHDSIKLLARMSLDQSQGIPSLWVFLIIVLAILLAVVLTTSVIMHWIQRRQRRSLQRRVQNGEVDLESLGIKRLQVPQEALDTMPQYIYTSKSGEELESKSPIVAAPKPVSTAPTKGAKVTTKSAIGAAEQHHEVAFSQATCPICLEDFVSGETNVRELPCNHIFHPECVDTFLRDTSSLCPMCKKSALPSGFCPITVTNLMVRRERLMRRNQSRGNSVSAFTARLIRLHAAQRQASIAASQRAATSAEVASPAAEDPAANTLATELPVYSRRQTTVEDIPAEIRAQGVSARRAWLRERLARRDANEFEQRANEGRVAEESRPLCKLLALF
jgi:hypothetical protein